MHDLNSMQIRTIVDHLYRKWHIISFHSFSLFKLVFFPFLKNRSYNPYHIDWEKFSILEMISLAEETWRKFDPANLDCQKRLICELHQNAFRLGFVAEKIVNAFRYDFLDTFFLLFLTVFLQLFGVRRSIEAPRRPQIPHRRLLGCSWPWSIIEEGLRWSVRRMRLFGQESGPKVH